MTVIIADALEQSANAEIDSEVMILDISLAEDSNAHSDTLTADLPAKLVLEAQNLRGWYHCQSEDQGLQ